MVGIFRRSLSFPNKMSIPNTPSSKVRAPMLSHHTRSISLPTRSHPLISQLNHHIVHLQSWAAAPNPIPASSSSLSDWLCQGLTRLKDLYHCLDDTLHLPQTQEALRGHLHSQQQGLISSCSWDVDNLLEQFLRFVDVYGILRTSVLALKQDHSAAQVAIRKRDHSQMALYLKSRKRMAKKMTSLINAVRGIRRPGLTLTAPLVHSGGVAINYCNIVDRELAGVMCDVVQVTVTVSLAVFSGIAAALSFGESTLRPASSSKSLRLSCMGINLPTDLGLLFMNRTCKVITKKLLTKAALDDEDLRKKGDEEVKITLKKMQELEASIAAIETCCHSVFRSLINARVSLLNTLTLL